MIECILGIIGPSGSIQGCFDETFDGITVSSNNNNLFSSYSMSTGLRSIERNVSEP